MEDIKNIKLTGEFRFQKYWFGYVLYVQFTGIYTCYDYDDNTLYEEPITRWRKATCEDIRTLNFQQV